MASCRCVLISLALLLGLAAVAVSANELLGYSASDLRSQTKLISLFDSWNAKHGKSYGNDPVQRAEKHKRFHIFRRNLMYIHAHNTRRSNSFKLGLTKFADLTHEEFMESRRFGLRVGVPKLASRRSRAVAADEAAPYAIPESVDWRELGAVTAPKDQGMCGSCWAFSAAGAIEGANAVATGKLVSVSEQELVTCDVGGQSSGCNGGLMDDAFEWVINNGGIATEEEYPYASSSGEAGVCNTKLQSEDKTISIDDYVDVEPYNEEALMAAVAKRPVSVAIDASAYDFQLYADGVYNGTCSSDPYAINHGVLLVGFGTENGVNYWLVKNSWSKSWGDGGFIKMIRDGSTFGTCAILSMSSYPVKYASSAPLVADA